MRGDPRIAGMRQQLATDIAGCSIECARIVDALFAEVPCGYRRATVRALADWLDVNPQTLQSRFFRAGLPSVKRYVAWAGLVFASIAAETEQTPTAVALAMDMSSPQHFNRHTKLQLGMTASQFVRNVTPEIMFDLFRQHLVIPHVDALRKLQPTRPKLWADAAWVRRRTGRAA